MTNRNKGREVRRPINIKLEINNIVHNFVVLLRFAMVSRLSSFQVSII